MILVCWQREQVQKRIGITVGGIVKKDNFKCFIFVIKGDHKRMIIVAKTSQCQLKEIHKITTPISKNTELGIFMKNIPVCCKSRTNSFRYSWVHKCNLEDKLDASKVGSMLPPSYSTSSSLSSLSIFFSKYKQLIPHYF